MDGEFLMCLKNSSLCNNYLTAKFLWVLNTTVSSSSLFGVERYIYLFDIVNLQTMKCRQFFSYLDPSSQKDGVWEKTKLLFIPCNAVLSSRDIGFFFQLLEGIENTEYYLFSVEKTNEIISDFSQHCFTLECLRAIFMLI